MNIEEKLNYLSIHATDINEHLYTLKRYAEECETVVELGVAKPVSTWAFIAAKPKKLISVDIVHPKQRGSTLDDVINVCSREGIEFEFRQEDSRTTELPTHDLLFIDTLHKYDVIAKELQMHSTKTKKYIIIHDTITFGSIDEFGNGPGLNKAINEFLLSQPQWKVKEIFTNNNGLTVLEKND
jgi:hypothetical protein